MTLLESILSKYVWFSRPNKPAWLKLLPSFNQRYNVSYSSYSSTPWIGATKHKEIIRTRWSRAPVLRSLFPFDRSSIMVLRPQLYWCIYIFTHLGTWAFNKAVDLSSWHDSDKRMQNLCTTRNQVKGTPTLNHHQITVEARKFKAALIVHEMWNTRWWFWNMRR